MTYCKIKHTKKRNNKTCIDLKNSIKQQNYLIIILQNVLWLFWSIDDSDPKPLDISPNLNR